MVHVIPLSIAQRRLDTGNAPQYLQRSPIGGGMQGLGDHLSAVAERYQQMRDEQEEFDAELARRRFNGQIAQAEDEVTANAPADGAGLHEAMYARSILIAAGWSRPGCSTSCLPPLCPACLRASAPLSPGRRKRCV
ncbi:hypothetical protein [Mesorhizobium sp. LNHC209A00]|uniref:hypothetical protein n=1 Tax=Mesorhizobium TaxID=68287 RepID=UPI0003D05E31|nr:hypothetical protein [Mesorhizobium sp. LNHC209A00]ESY92419.1 hypothetical protein X738_27455 [Mesorhizobium sp. LNHC209A00]